MFVAIISRTGAVADVAAFHIESPGQNEVIQGVTPPPDSYALGAPSRPPSRSNSRSPLGRMVDWSANESGNFLRRKTNDGLIMMQVLRIVNKKRTRTCREP